MAQRQNQDGQDNQHSAPSWFCPPPPDGVRVSRTDRESGLGGSGLRAHPAPAQQLLVAAMQVELTPAGARYTVRVRPRVWRNQMARRRQGLAGRSRTPGRARASRPIAGPAAFRDVADPSHVLSQAATLLLIGAHLRGDTAAVRARAEASGKLLHPVARRRLQAIPSSDLRQLGFPRLPVGAPRLQPEALQRAAGVRFASAPAPTPSRGEARTAAATLRRAV